MKLYEKNAKILGFSDEEFKKLADPITVELVEDFLRQSQKSDQTLKQYKSGLYIFCKFVYDELGNKPVTKLKIRDAMRYQNKLVDIGLSDSAIKFKRSVVSAFYLHIEAFWSDEYPDVRNIFTKAVPNVGNQKKKEKVPLTSAEIKKLTQHLMDTKRWQQLAYLTYTYQTGCRREESRQLKKEVVEYSKYVNPKGVEKNYYMTHSIRAKGRGKTGKIRKFQFGEDAMVALQKWIEERGEDDCEYMFVSRSKETGEYKQISPDMFNAWCTQWGKFLGKKVHPHLLRSSRATNSVVEDGKDIKAVQQLLGHNSSSTTEIYIVRDDEDEIDALF